MRLPSILVLLISSSTFAQNTEMLVHQSPDKKFSLSATGKEIGDSNTELTYWLKNEYGDSIVLTTSIVHDMPAPVAYWDKSSTKLIYEEQTHGTKEIRIYDLIEKKLTFQTHGFIWGCSMEYFDQENGIIIFFRRIDNEQHRDFDIISLNIETKKISVIRSIRTSGDPYTGAPDILSMDRAKREIILIFETRDEFSTKMETLKVSY